LGFCLSVGDDWLTFRKLLCHRRQRASQRMRATGFPDDDALYMKVGLALEAMRAVAMDLHRRQHSMGVDLGPKTK
jgi:hypothetical protein